MISKHADYHLMWDSFSFEQLSAISKVQESTSHGDYQGLKNVSLSLQHCYILIASVGKEMVFFR